MYQKQLLLVCITPLYTLTLPMLVHYGVIIIMLQCLKIVKLQNKAVRVINDVPLMEPRTPHYLSLHILKFPDIVKLNTCMLFYDYFHHEKFPNIPVSLVSELHNYNTRSATSNQIFIPSFRTNLRRFFPSIIGCFFWNNIPDFIRDKPSKKLCRKALLRWYLAQY